MNSQILEKKGTAVMCELLYRLACLWCDFIFVAFFALYLIFIILSCFIIMFVNFLYYRAMQLIISNCHWCNVMGDGIVFCAYYTESVITV